MQLVAVAGLCNMKRKQTVPLRICYRRLKRAYNIQQNLTGDNRYIASKHITHVLRLSHRRAQQTSCFVLAAYSVVHNMLITLFRVEPRAIGDKYN